jgi:very-short-patch-repair endonuclease
MVRDPRVCPECGQTFQPKSSTQITCSSKCGNVHKGKLLHDRANAIRARATCQHCGQTFIVQHTGNPNTYCSVACRRAMMRERMAGSNNPIYSRVDCTCSTCGKTFKRAPSQIHDGANYCSRPCLYAAGRKLTGAIRYNFKGGPGEITCVVCGKVKTVTRAELRTAHTCSQRCGGELGRRNMKRSSSLETTMAALFTEAGLPAQAQYPIGTCTVDFAFPDHHLVVECDGTYWHGLPDQRHRDLRRDKWLNRQGWFVLRLPEADIKAAPHECLDRVRYRLHQLASSGSISNDR